MYVIRENSIVPSTLKSIILTGKVEDFRIGLIEHIVATEFNVSIHELDIFYRDTEAKVMCCFLVHTLLEYNIESIAKKYRIYPGFLKNKIHELHVKCLNEKASFDLVVRLKDAFFCKENLLQAD